jgi:hypothetical protein
MSSRCPLGAAGPGAWEALASATPWTVKPAGDPFALVLALESEKRRDASMRALIARGVFPSLLWPLSWWRSERASRAVSKRLLTVSCDFRYPPGVVQEVASLLRSLA